MTAPVRLCVGGLVLEYLREFEILVKGRLSPTLIAAIDGSGVSRCDHGETHLVGWVPDQAALHGTREIFRDLNIELVSVNPEQG